MFVLAVRARTWGGTEVLKSTLASVTASVFLIGCVASQKIAAPETLDRLNHIHIVAMQSPPLLFPKRHLSEEMLADATYLSIVDSAIVASVVIKLKNSDESEPWEQQFEKAKNLLASGAVWLPAFVLAEQANQQLSVTTGRTSDMAPEARPLINDGHILLYPIGGRSFRDDAVEALTLGTLPYNPDTDVYWLTKHWYAENVSQIDYRDLAADETTGVLEVGVMQYEYDNLSGRFLVQIMMRLVDPATGKVIARVRNADYPKVDDPTTLLLNDAERLKQEFGQIGAQLVRDSLIEIGLM
jgi:hypothetical protein